MTPDEVGLRSAVVAADTGRDAVAPDVGLTTIVVAEVGRS